MRFQDQLNFKLKAAMREKDKVALESLRAIKSAILLLQTQPGAKENPDDTEIIKLNEDEDIDSDDNSKDDDNEHEKDPIDEPPKDEEDEDKPKEDKPKEDKSKEDKSKEDKSKGKKSKSTEKYCKLSDTKLRRRCTKTKLKSENSDECLYDYKTNYCRIKK